MIVTFAVWLIKKKLKFEVCPICAGVTLTWFWMLVGMFFGKLLVVDYQLPATLLMGGTVVGLMSKLEQFVKLKFVLIWKTIFVVLGFVAAYNLIFTNWVIFAVSVALVVVTTFVFKIRLTLEENQKSKQTRKLEEEMEKCC